MGTAFREIREGRLYIQTGFSSFETYALERWGLTIRRVYQLIEAADAATEVCKILHTSPANEAQAREYAPIKDDPDLIREVGESLPDRATAKVIRAAVRKARAAPVPERQSELTKAETTFLNSLAEIRNVLLSTAQQFPSKGLGPAAREQFEQWLENIEIWVISLKKKGST